MSPAAFFARPVILSMMLMGSRYPVRCGRNSRYVRGVTNGEAHRLAREKGVPRPLYALVRGTVYGSQPAGPESAFRASVLGMDREPAVADEASEQAAADATARELPVAGQPPRERRDAARNREAILAAAQRL